MLGWVTPAAPQVVLKAGDTEVALSGYLRIRDTGEFNFDLEDAADADEAVTFYDVRSYVSVAVRRKPFGGLLSLDLAGDEFNDGVVLGNEDPAFVREIELKIRHLWVEYDGVVHARLGRLPGQAGHAIVSHIIRDAFRVWKDAGPVTANFSLIKGGESLAVAPGSRKPRALNPPGGDDDDLDAVHFFLELELDPESKGRLEFLRHFDSSPDDRFPEKQYLDLNAGGKVGRISYAAEVAYMFGRTPAAGGRHLDHRAYLVYLDGAYRWGILAPGFRFGLGSGDDNPADDRQENFQNLFMDETGFRYTNIFADDIHGFDGTGASLANGAGFANVTFFQPRLGARPLPALSLAASLTFLLATVDRVEGSGPLGDRPATGSGLTRQVGQEVDLNATYRLDRYGSLFLFLGWFTPGRVYGEAADDAFKAEVGIEVRF